MSSGAGSWVVRMKPRSAARLRLLCVPYAGVGPSAFRRWAQEAPADIEVAVVHLPGREGRFREAPFTRLEPLIEAAAPALRDYLDLPSRGLARGARGGSRGGDGALCFHPGLHRGRARRSRARGGCTRGFTALLQAIAGRPDATLTELAAEIDAAVAGPAGVDREEIDL